MRNHTGIEMIVFGVSFTTLTTFCQAFLCFHFFAFTLCSAGLSAVACCSGRHDQSRTAGALQARSLRRDWCRPQIPKVVPISVSRLT